MTDNSLFRLEEELVQVTDKNRTLKKTMSDTQSKSHQDSDKLKKKIGDLQSELVSKQDEVRL